MTSAAATPEPVVRDLADFDPRSGSRLERALFNHRHWVLLLCAVATLWLGWQASTLRVNASFDRMIPSGHPYIANFLAHRQELSGLGNAVRIAVATEGESIYDPACATDAQGQALDCEALMVALDIGVKVATLPVIALGVGIGVDYALYVMSILLARLRAGDSLARWCC